MQDIGLVFITYILVINLAGLLIIAYDKRKAKLKGWRIPEARLFLLAFAGGAIGIFIGMKLFHHKTMHFKFTFGIPVLILLNMILFYFIFKGE